jgi:hypothetical protein
VEWHIVASTDKTPFIPSHGQRLRAQRSKMLRMGNVILLLHVWLLYRIGFFIIMATFVFSSSLFVPNDLGADLAVDLTANTGGDILFPSSAVLLQTRRRRAAAVDVLIVSLCHTSAE